MSPRSPHRLDLSPGAAAGAGVREKKLEIMLAQHQQALCYLLGFRQIFMLLSTQLLLLFLLQHSQHLVLVTPRLTLIWRTIH